MDHHDIEEQSLVDRYVLGHLTAEERTRFEDHFVDCPQCLDDLEAARDFRSALRDGAAEELARQTVAAGLWAWLRRPARATVLVLALAVAVLPFLWRDGPPAEAPEPLVNIPTYRLGALRGEDSSGVLSSPADAWLTLVLEMEDEEADAVFELQVRDATGAVAWRRGGVRPDRGGAVAVTFPPRALPAGEYRLVLVGRSPEGEDVEVTADSFRRTE